MLLNLLLTIQVVPELNATSISAALGLLAGGVLILRSFMGRKK